MFSLELILMVYTGAPAESSESNESKVRSWDLSAGSAQDGINLQSRLWTGGGGPGEI